MPHKFTEQNCRRSHKTDGCKEKDNRKEFQQYLQKVGINALHCSGIPGRSGAVILCSGDQTATARACGNRSIRVIRGFCFPGRTRAGGIAGCGVKGNPAHRLQIGLCPCMGVGTAQMDFRLILTACPVSGKALHISSGNSPVASEDSHGGGKGCAVAGFGVKEKRVGKILSFCWCIRCGGILVACQICPDGF